MSAIEIDQITQAIIDKLRSEYSPIKIILYGSYAAGTPKPDSDIDLLIIKETDERFIDRWVTVRKILSDPLRKIAVEPLILTPREVAVRLSRGDQFINDVINKGRVLYAA